MFCWATVEVNFIWFCNNPVEPTKLLLEVIANELPALPESAVLFIVPNVCKNPITTWLAFKNILLLGPKVIFSEAGPPVITLVLFAVCAKDIVPVKVLCLIFKAPVPSTVNKSTVLPLSLILNAISVIAAPPTFIPNFAPKSTTEFIDVFPPFVAWIIKWLPFVPISNGFCPHGP